MFHDRNINMKSMKQQGIMVYLNKKDKSKIFETGNCQNGNEANISRLIANLEKLQKEHNSDKLGVTEESEKQKGEFDRE